MSHTRPPRAVILGIGEHPRCVATIRSLAREGIELLGVDHLPADTRTRTCYLKNRISVPSDPERQIQCLESLGRDGGGVLICTSDHSLIAVARNHGRLAKVFTMTTPPWDRLGRLMDKPRCYALARELGLQTPGFVAPCDLGEMEREVDGLDFEGHAYVLKTRVWDSGPANPRNGRCTVFAGSDAPAVKERFREIASRTRALPVIEEIVPGDTDTCIGVSMVVGRDHQPGPSLCVKRLKLYPYARSGEFEHPYELGANTYCESVHDPEAVAAATRLVQGAGYYGMITVEFRRDADDGALKLIKVDPRPVRATSLSTALGLDLPSALYRTFTGTLVDPPRDYRDGIAWLWLTAYVETLVENRDHTPVRKELLSVLRRAHSIRAFGLLSARDPIPFLAQVRHHHLPRIKNRLRRALRLPRVAPGSSGG